MNQPRILIVEDNPVVAGMIRHLLSRSAYSIAGMATSGEDALELASQYRPDLTLMDVELAGPMDGIEAARLIWSRWQIPVVYLTSSSDDETVYRAASTEAFGYLHKPVKERELICSIQIALSKHEADLNLQEKERWLETTLQCISDAVIAADSVGCVKLMNPAAEALTGWRQKSAVGRDLLEVFRILEHGTRLPAECAVTQVVRGGRPPSRGQKRILVALNGVESVVEENTSPILNDRGEIIGVVLVFRPITAAPDVR